MNHSDFDKHFTVNWYGKEDEIQKIQWKEFVKEFEDTYGKYISWLLMKRKIYECLKQVIVSSVICEPRMKDTKVL